MTAKQSRTLGVAILLLWAMDLVCEGVVGFKPSPVLSKYIDLALGGSALSYWFVGAMMGRLTPTNERMTR